MMSLFFPDDSPPPPELPLPIPPMSNEHQSSTVPQQTSGQLLSCTLVSFGETFSCDSAGDLSVNSISSVSGPAGASVLFDGDHNTCYQPLDGQDTMLVMFDTSNTQSSPDVTVSIIGTGINCNQPSTLLFMSISCLSAKPTQCGLSRVEDVQTGMECSYICKIISPCDGSARVTLQMIHVTWLHGDTNVSQLCEVRAYIYA